MQKIFQAFVYFVSDAVKYGEFFPLVHAASAEFVEAPL